MKQILATAIAAALLSAPAVAQANAKHHMMHAKKGHSAMAHAWKNHGKMSSKKTMMKKHG